MLVAALEEDRLGGRSRVPHTDDPPAREERGRVDRLAALLQAIARDEHDGGRREPRERLEVGVAGQNDDVRSARVITDIGVACKVVTNFHTFTDYTYLLAHELFGRETK